MSEEKVTIRQQVEAAGARGLLSSDFDAALLGYVTRYDIPAIAAYQLEELVPIAGAQWGENDLVAYLSEQSMTNRELVLVDTLPKAKEFWALVAQGMLVWEYLNSSIVGLAMIGGKPCALYHREHALQSLASMVDDTEQADITPGVTEFFVNNIDNATLGPRTPLLLHAAKWPKENNGLGPSRPGRQTLELKGF